MTYNECKTCGANNSRAGNLVNDECLNCYDTRRTGAACMHSNLQRTPEELKKTFAIISMKTLTERTTAALSWIDAQLALCNAATDKPWEYDMNEWVHSLSAGRPAAALPSSRANGKFIAAARNGYPAMLESTKHSLLAFMEIEAHGFCQCDKAINFILTPIEALK